MTLEQQHKSHSNYVFQPAQAACAHTQIKTALWPYRMSRGSPLLAALCCGMLSAIALTGCSSYSSNGKTYTTTPTTTTSQALWVANGKNVVEFTSTSLTTMGSAAAVPALVVNSSAFAAPQGVVFDASANLWVIDGGTVSTGGTAKPALYQFTSAQLAGIQAGASVSPNLTINSKAFTFPQQAVFDSKGDLWVSDNGSNAVFEFMPSQLTASGTAVTPNITIQSKPAFNGALGIAFDSSGDLWIANNGTTTIFEFNAAALPMTGGSVTLAPNIMLSDDGHGSIQAPWALAFDTAGNLWSSNANAPNTVVQFSKASLAATGNPTPAVTLSTTMVSGNASLSSPNGIAFDNTGDLSVVSSAAP